MADKTINLDVNNILELEYLVEEISDDSINVMSGDSSDLGYLSRNKAILNPSSTGTYELEINGKIVEINVTDIPSSVELQYYGDRFETGDNLWVDDTETVDMNIIGDPQSSQLSDGSESVKFDGSDDYGLITLPSSLEGSSLSSHTIEFAVDFTTTSDSTLLGFRNSSDQRIKIEPNRNGSYNNDPGNLLFTFEDNSNNVDIFDIGTSNLDDGNRHDLTFIVNDSTVSDYTVIVDGNTQSLSFTSTGGPSSFESWDYDVGVSAFNNGSISSISPINFGAIRWHSTNISDQTISNY